MDKEEYRKAFEAAKEYWQWVQTDEPMLHKPIDFEEWYDTVVLPQANVIKSVCGCGNFEYKPNSCAEEGYCRNCRKEVSQTVRGL